MSPPRGKTKGRGRSPRGRLATQSVTFQKLSRSSLLGSLDEVSEEESLELEHSKMDLEESGLVGDNAFPLETLKDVEQSAKEGHDEEEMVSEVSDIKMQMTGCGDVISQCRLLSHDVCPRIPLCRMVAHAVVRGIRADIASLKSAFQYEGYLPEKGSFVVSTCKYDGDEKCVTQAIKSCWSPLWREVDEEFEKEIAARQEFKFLSGKMFFVWEGNHRLTAWMESISQMYKDNKARHVCVVCSVIDPRQTSEISLLTGLQRVNTMNEYAIVKPSLRDVLWNCSNIFKCDINAFLSALPQDQVKLLESLRARDASLKGKQQWYPLTRGYLARLVFQVEYTSELNKIEEMVSSTIPTENKEEALKKERTKIHKRLSDRMGMVLNVLDPKLGDQWLAIIFGLRFDSPDSVITLAKLRSLANAEMREEKRLMLLSLLDSNKRMKDMYGMPTSDNEYRVWLVRECFLEKVEVEALQSLEDLKRLCLLGSSFDLSHDYTLQDYLEGVKLEGRKYMFAQVRAREQVMEARASKKGEGSQQRKKNEVIMAACRVVFRYLSHLIGEKKLTRMPDLCKGWLDRSNEDTCMYPKSMHNLSNWEIAHCPWWIDLGSGFVLAREKDMYNIHHNKDSSPHLQVFGSRPRKESRDKKDEHEEVEDSPTWNDVAQGKKTKDDDGIATKEIIPFVFYPSFPLALLSGHDDGVSYGCMVGDYLAIGQDFVARRKNDSYKIVHEFFSKIAKEAYAYKRLGKSVSWACDLVFIDLPTGCLMEKSATIPSWNVLTESHVRMAITVAATSLADSGWLVVWVTLAGNALSWLERYIHVLGLEVVRRVFVHDKIPYGFEKQSGLELVMRSSLLVFARRTGCRPPTFIVDSHSHFRRLQIDPASDYWTHYLPERSKMTLSSSSTLWRGALERSSTFISCVLHLLCPPSGLVLEMGCGTAPLLRACQASHRSCFSFDDDYVIVDDVVQPLVQAASMKKAHVGDEEVVELNAYRVQIVDNPYDDY